MTDTFQISGDELRFGPWTVGRLDPAMPATVRDQVEELILDMRHEELDDAYNRGYVDSESAGGSEYERGLKDGRSEALQDLKEGAL